jgi:hypothetical protein
LQELILPAWLPATIRASFPVALQKHLDAGHDPAAPLRLACDPRMKAVWRELQKRHRKTGKPFHEPAQFAGGPDRAILMLFAGAMDLYLNSGNSPLASEIEQKVAHWRERAKLLREIQEEIAPYQGISSNGGGFFELTPFNTPFYGFLHPGKRNIMVGSSAPVLQAFHTTCIWFDSLANVYQDGLLCGATVERRRIDRRIRGFVFQLANKTSSIYRKPLYRTVATITSVLYEQEVSEAVVRRCVAKETKSSI